LQMVVHLASLQMVAHWVEHKYLEVEVASWFLLLLVLVASLVLALAGQVQARMLPQAEHVSLGEGGFPTGVPM